MDRRIPPNVLLGSARQRVNCSAELRKNLRHFCDSAFAAFCVNLKSLYFIVAVVYSSLVTIYLPSK